MDDLHVLFKILLFCINSLKAYKDYWAFKKFCH